MENGRNARDERSGVTPLHRGTQAHPGSPPMKVIAYVRVSTTEQAENGVSLDAQAEKIQGYCPLNGWQCIDVVRDDGYSAKDLKRPGLQQILEEVPLKTRRFDGIVVTKLDRLTRSVRDLAYLTDLAEKHKVALISIEEHLDTGTATGKLLRAVLLCLSEWERDVIAERTCEALAHKRRNGERIGTIPYGYALAEDGKHLAPIRAEMEVVAEIVKKRKRGMSYDRIADDLNAERIPTKCGGQWYPATVRSVWLTARKREAMQVDAQKPTPLLKPGMQRTA